MDWHTTCCTAQKLKFPRLSFLISWPLTMTIQAMWGMFSAAFMCFPPYLGIGCVSVRVPPGIGTQSAYAAFCPVQLSN